MKVTVLSKPDCEPCKATKKWLEQKGITYEAKDVSKDPAAMDELIRLGYRSVPVVIVNADTNWFGFRPDMLAGLLE